VRGVWLAGLRTIAQPVASAGASFHAAARIGKFHGMIWAATPTGSRSVMSTIPSPIGIVCPKNLSMAPA
jgi:hypothetical protein